MEETEMINQPKDHQPRVQLPAGDHGQMAPSQQPKIGTGEWSSDLFACGKDCDTFCRTAWCPCVTFGQIAEIVDEGSTSCFWQGTMYTLLSLFPCIYSYLWRTKIRSKYGITGGGSRDDFCTHFWCEPCALHQEFRELQHHGFADPSRGWEWYQRAQMNHPTAAPTPPGAMMK